MTRRWVVAFLAVADFAVLVASGGILWLERSSPVSVAEAVRRYRTELRDLPASPDTGTVPASRSESPGTRPTEPSSGPAPVGPASPTKTPEPNVFAPPAPGVYSWRTHGWEQGGVVRRELPSESQRIVTREDARRWTSHHLFSNDHEEWFDAVLSGDGASTIYHRARIAFGPVGDDRSMTFEPPVEFARFPLQVGRRWEGAWSGPTSGRYRSYTFERTRLRIGDRTVEAWGTETVMTFWGEITGEATTIVWIAPAVGMSVKERHDRRVRMDRGDYRSDITITLLDAEPRR